MNTNDISPAASAPAAAPSGLTESSFTALVDRYFDHIKDQTTSDYIDHHAEGLIRTPFKYWDSLDLEVLVTAQPSGHYLLTDLEYFCGEYWHIKDQLSTAENTALLETLNAVIDDETIQLDPRRGLWCVCTPVGFTDCLHRFIHAALAVDRALVFFLETRARATRATQCAAAQEGAAA